MTTELPAPKPEMLKRHLLSVQVCVPENYTDEQVVNFANIENPAGTTHGWQIRREGDEKLAGDAERVTCLGRSGCVHVMLDC